MNIPDCFCWSRFGTEAGQSIERILVRKEDERSANDGIFLWGIGNALGPSVRALIEKKLTPQVLFSPIKSTPRGQDVTPQTVVAWSCGITLSGKLYTLPKHSIVTSSYNMSSPTKRYALVCYSNTPLIPLRSTARTIAIGELVNLLSGRPVGSSQVTAVVRREASPPKAGPYYDISISANLVPPYFIELQKPISLSTDISLDGIDQSWVSDAIQLINHSCCNESQKSLFTTV
jgi:hypothetical protein